MNEITIILLFVFLFILSLIIYNTFSSKLTKISDSALKFMSETPNKLINIPLIRLYRDSYKYIFFRKGARNQIIHRGDRKYVSARKSQYKSGEWKFASRVFFMVGFFLTWLVVSLSAPLGVFWGWILGFVIGVIFMHLWPIFVAFAIMIIVAVAFIIGG